MRGTFKPSCTLYTFSAAVEVVADFEDCALGYVPIVGHGSTARKAILLGYAIDVIVWATHCTMAAINKMMVMRPSPIQLLPSASDKDHFKLLPPVLAQMTAQQQPPRVVAAKFVLSGDRAAPNGSKEQRPHQA